MILTRRGTTRRTTAAAGPALVAARGAALDILHARHAGTAPAAA